VIPLLISALSFDLFQILPTFFTHSSCALALFQSLSYFLSILTLSFSLLLSIALLPFNHIFSLALLPLSITHSFAHLLSLIVVTLIVSRYLSFMIFHSCSVFSCSLYLSHTHILAITRNGSVISSLTLFHRGYNFAFTFPRIRLVSLYNVSFLNKVANGRSGFSAESKSII